MCWTVEDTISYIPSEDGIDSFWFFFTFIFLFHNLCLPPSLSSFLKGGRINISIFWINISILIIVVQLLSHANPLQSHGPQHARLPCPSVSWSLLKLVSIELVIPCNHLILCRPLLSCLQLSQHQGLFQSVSSSHQVAKVLELNLQYQSFQRIFRTNFL